ncbi:MAG TPA: phosphoenolpyruvate--protein phosphotransferase [Caulobacterales bacterium]|jgi:phosphotransferase system enzyme I (PtsP)|nr:phosphoenolpyruvate--protein phosphotransferase [Rhizomicrobium sp.]HVY83527.1 phosphoenolpyruvate--protein phosphotransferase [Caulobacterales bacterium]HWA30418.1 phosphoenolpyruvate--protein phosphotransferase [Rhizomicrobium sp.]
MPPVSAGGPRILLRRLREIMAERASAQTRLDKLVSVIASNMVAEVCSIYLRRAGSVLELFATEGLNPEAVHRTRLKEGEGLVGLVAETGEAVNLSDAPSDPHFSYRPETGEDPFKAFLGVPIVRGGQVFGVLTVQNKAARLYAEEEVEALQTVAMVLAEVVAQGGLFDIAELDEPELRVDRPLVFHGEGLSEGVAVGHVVLHEPRVKIEKMIAENPQAELVRLEAAIGAMRDSVDHMLDSSELDLTGEGREVIEAYRLFAYDQGWRQRMRDAIATGLTAEAAVERVQDDMRLRVARLGDPILRERAHDLDDLARRLLRHLTGEEQGASELPEDAVLVARALGPADLVDYGRGKLVALVLEDAASTSHVAIVARSLNVPLVGSAEGVTDAARNGDLIAVDGDAGEVYLRPMANVVSSFEAKRALRANRVAQFAQLRDLPAVTKDGIPIKLMMNAGLMLDMPHLEESGADGIGLFRTELQFMIGETMPRLSDQIAFYKQVLEAAGDKPVVFRTLDLGGDKVLPYARWEREENPALGWRALRIALDRPALLRYQIRALLTAAAGSTLRVLLPLVSDVAEFNQARALIDREIERARLLSRPQPRQVLVGAMLEVPALAFMLPQIMRSADFVSIGSNDLFQFVFAVDRTNPRVARRYDPLNPAALTLIRLIVKSAAEAGGGGELSLCGEMAGKPLDAMALIGSGLRTLSMQPSQIGPIKAMIRSMHAGEVTEFVEKLCGRTDHSLRTRLSAFAAERGIVLK